MSAQQILAALVLAVCVAMLVLHFAGARRQAQVSHWWRGRMAKVRQSWNRLRLWRRTRQLRRAQRDARQASEAMKGVAAREAADAIDRARRRAQIADGGAEDGGANESGANGTQPDGVPGSPGRAGPGGPRGDNVVRPQRFGNRRNDLH